jgi:D-alanyl-D-alanine carboxypeptidase/D-alanyl-D-alanine-endopeptidase (penicillin-binding protein 4)
VVGEGRGSDPALYAATALRQALLAADILVDKGAHTGALSTPGTTIAGVSSAPLSTEIARINLPSDNFAAEMLVKDLGASFGSAGSTTTGTAIVRATLGPLGLQPTVVDGSGLSRTDQVSPRELVTLLSAMAGRPEGVALRASLPVVGRSGTLATRMRGTAARDRCQAKTGTLIGVSALSGYCTTQGGDVVAFSFMENGMDSSHAKRVEDQMLPAIARYAPPAG